jgi:CRP-like cAMP-binding protein
MRCAVGSRRAALVCFPLDCLISAVTQFRDGTPHEVGTVGRDGNVGAFEVMCAIDATYDAIVQIAGWCLVIEAGIFVAELERDAPLRQRVLRYEYAARGAVEQLAACNASHSLEGGTAKWLLTAHDYVGGDHLSLTHGVLAEMLSVRRAGVTEAALRLRDKGVIDYRRGQIAIVNRAMLEALACECYTISSERMREILGYDVRKTRAAADGAPGRRLRTPV